MHISKRPENPIPGPRDKPEDAAVLSEQQPENKITGRGTAAHATRPDLVESFTRRTFTWMVEGVRAQAIDAGLIDADSFDCGVRDLYRTAERDGVFCYTFFKGVGVQRSEGCESERSVSRESGTGQS